MFTRVGIAEENFCSNFDQNLQGNPEVKFTQICVDFGAEKRNTIVTSPVSPLAMIPWSPSSLCTRPPVITGLHVIAAACDYLQLSHVNMTSHCWWLDIQRPAGNPGTVVTGPPWDWKGEYYVFILNLYPDLRILLQICR